MFCGMFDWKILLKNGEKIYETLYKYIFPMDVGSNF